MLSGELSRPLSTGWWSIIFFWQTFNTWVRPWRRSFAHSVGGNGNVADYWNLAAQSCWTFHQDAGIIASLSEMYRMAVICLFWVRDSFCIVWGFHCPATLQTSHRPWLFHVISFASPLSAIPSHFQFLWYWMLGNHLPMFHYWLQQTALLWLLPEQCCQWF